MVGPFSSVKEQTLPHYAERLADAGYTVLTFDPRSFGESEGQPRWHYDPSQIIQDYTNAVSYLRARPDVDPQRMGLVGVCMGGGYALSAAARDKRVRAVASVAGGYRIGATFQRAMGVDGFARYLARINALTTEQYQTGEVQYVPTIAHGLSDDTPVAAMPSDEPYSYYERTHRTDAPTWSDRMTAAGLEPYLLYDAIGHAPLVAPTPLLIVHGTTDFFLLPEYAQAATTPPAARSSWCGSRRTTTSSCTTSSRTSARPWGRWCPGSTPTSGSRRRRHRTPGRRPPAPRRERPWPGTRVARCCPWSSPWGWWSPGSGSRCRLRQPRRPPGRPAALRRSRRRDLNEGAN